MMTKIDRFRGSLLGLACGDAVGTTVEFKSRGTFAPVEDMVGGGPFDLNPGEWTDDTSMALCIASSLLECEGFDPRDIMLRFCRWMDGGYLSSNGVCFDIGNTVEDALEEFKLSGEPFSGATDPQTAGNGCLMRLAPIPMYFHADLGKAVTMAERSSRLTHGAPECVDATRLFAAILHRALSGMEKHEILSGEGLPSVISQRVNAISAGDYRKKSENSIRGTGYVVDSLEAALWCFERTDDFEEAILQASNLGDDADTTAAICGQLAGAHYGMSGIPEGWLGKLAMVDDIKALADRLEAKSVERQ